MNIIQVTVPSKIHLLGEHAVVYGKPAILISVGLYSEFTVEKRSDNQIIVKSHLLSKEIQTNFEEIIAKTESSQKLWYKFNENNDIEILKSIIQTPEDYVFCCLGETFKFFDVKNISGFEINIKSDVPIGAGLGSSAVVGAGISGVLSQFLDKDFSKSDINNITYNCEQLRHGNPSGGDPATVIYGGLVWFRKEMPDLRIIQPLPFTLSVNTSSSFLLIDTGKPNESTGELVSGVRALYEKDKPAYQKIFDHQETLVKDLYKSLQENNLLETINFIKLGEANLEKIGVVSPVVKQLIREIENSGGAAKICGGGGKTAGTGIILAMHQDKSQLKQIAEKFNFKYFDAKLGVEGVRVQG